MKQTQKYQTLQQKEFTMPLTLVVGGIHKGKPIKFWFYVEYKFNQAPAFGDYSEVAEDITEFCSNGANILEAKLIEFWQDIPLNHVDYFKKNNIPSVKDALGIEHEDFRHFAKD